MGNKLKTFTYKDIVLDRGAPGELLSIEMDPMGKYESIDLKNMKMAQSSFPLLEDHDYQKCIGAVEVRPDLKTNTLYGDIISEHNLSGRYPSIGFEIVEMYEQDGKTFITKAVLKNVGVCAAVNIDPSIPPIQ